VAIIGFRGEIIGAIDGAAAATEGLVDREADVAKKSIEEAAEGAVQLVGDAAAEVNAQIEGAKDAVEDVLRGGAQGADRAAEAIEVAIEDASTSVGCCHCTAAR